MKKIELVEDEEMTKIFAENRNRPHELQIFMKSGESYVQRVTDPQGSPKNPVSDSELISKFRGLTSPVLPNTKLEKLIDSIMKLEDVEDVRELTELM